MKADQPGARDGVYLLRGVLICGLVVSAGSVGGVLQASLRSTVPLLGGLLFGTAIADAERTGGVASSRWILHLAVMWLATLSPAMWGDREVLRTCAVSGGLAILMTRSRRGQLLAGTILATVVAIAALAVGRPSWVQGGIGELGYAVGVAWPRGWGEVARDMALFVFGCAAADGRGVRVMARWRGIAEPLRALGRMPLTVAAVQYVVVVVLTPGGPVNEYPSWVRPALVDGCLIAELAFAAWWLRERERGPCEHAIHMARTTLLSLRLGAGRVA